MGPLPEGNFSKFRYYFATTIDKAQAESNNSLVPPVTAVAVDSFRIAAQLPGCRDIPTSGFFGADAPWIFRELRLSLFSEVVDAH
jgi:hypothetical protein